MAKIHRTQWFDAGWFPYRYAFCPNAKAWAETTKRHPDRPRYPESAGCTSMYRDTENKMSCAVVTVLDREPQAAVALLAHEAMHVWQDICETLGENRPSSELEAYAIQNILTNLMNAYQKTRGPLFTRRRP